MAYTESTLGVGGDSASFEPNGSKFDIIIQGITSGTVKLQYKLPVSAIKDTPVWTDFPNGTYSADTYTSIEVVSKNVQFRLLGVDNNAGIYIKMVK